MNKNNVFFEGKGHFKPLEQADIPIIVAAFAAIGWDKQAALYQQYLREQAAGQRLVWVAFAETVFVGYVTLKWQSDYPFFQAEGIPEINDLNVLPPFRNQGVGSKLLDLAEAAAQNKSTCVGLGVGLYADYGPAQRLYVNEVMFLMVVV